MSLRGVDLANATGPAVEGVDYANRTGLQQPAQYYPAPPMGEAEKGVRRGVSSLVGTAQSSLAQLLEPFAPKMSDSLFEEATKTLNFGPELQPKVPNIHGIHDVGSGIDWAAGQLGEVAPQAAVMGAAGLVGGAAGLGLRMNAARAAQLAAGATFVPPAMGSTALTLHSDPTATQNTTPLQRLALSGGVGAGSAALMATPILGSAKRAFAGSALEKGFAPALGHIGEEALRTGAHLGAATAGSTALEQATHSYANPYRDTSHDVEALKESAIGGASVGALLGGVGGLTHAVRNAVKPTPPPPKPEFAPGLEAGYKTAEALDNARRYAADTIKRAYANLGKSVDKKVKSSLDWTDAKQRMLDELMADDSPVKEAMKALSPEHQKAAVGMFDMIDTAPDTFRAHPDWYEALHTIFEADPNDIAQYVAVKANMTAAKQDEAIAKAKAAFEKLSPEEKAKRMQRAGVEEPSQLGDEEARVAPKHDEVSREDEGGGRTPDEKGTDIEGDLQRLFPTHDKPITQDILQKSLQGEHWMRNASKDDKTQAHLPLYAKSETLPPEEILKLFQLPDREKRGTANVDVTRDHTPEELTSRSQGGYARLNVRPWSLAQEVSRSPKRENFPTDEAHAEAVKQHYEGLPDYRDKWQKGTDNSRKGDLFMHSMATLLNEGMDVKGSDGKTHHITFQTGKRGLPEGLILGDVKKGGGGYTLNDYRNEKPAWTPKDAKALKMERDVAKEYEKIKGSYEWGKKINEELGQLTKQRVETQGTDAFGPINQRYQAVLSLQKQRNFLAAEHLKEALINRDGELPKHENIWDAASKEMKNAAYAQATHDVHPLVRTRNARATVMDSMKTLYGALQDKVLDRLTTGERTPELIDDLKAYLDGEEATPALKEFFKENGVPEYTRQQLEHKSMAHEKTGETPTQWLREQLDWTKNKAEEAELSGVLDEAAIADVKYGQNMEPNAKINEEVLKEARGLIKSIDEGKAPLNDKGALAASKLPIDRLTRDLGLKIQEDPLKNIDNIRAAIDRADIASAQAPKAKPIGYTSELVNDINMRPAKPGPFAMKEEPKAPNEKSMIGKAADLKTPEERAKYEAYVRNRWPNKADELIEKWRKTWAEKDKELPPDATSVKAGPEEPAKAQEELKEVRAAQPDPYPGLIKKMNEIHQRIVGKQSRILSEALQEPKPGEIARTTLIDAENYDLNKAQLKSVRDERRMALAEGDNAKAEELLKMEQKLLDKTAVLSLIRFAPHLAEREMTGAMYHETMHAAFHVLLNNEERSILGTAFTQGTAARRLRELFKDEPAVLEHLKDAEEAAAYAFQIHASAPELLNLGAKTQSIFAKIGRFFRDLLGVMTPEEKAKIIMDDMLSGRRLERGETPALRVLEKNMTGPQKLQKLARTFGGVVKSGWDIMATSSYERIKDFKNPALQKVIDAGYTKQSTEDMPLGYVHAERAAGNRFTNELGRLFKNHEVADINAGIESLILGREPPTPAAAAARRAWEQYATEMRQYAKSRGMDIGFEKNYFPMGWSAEKVLNNKQAFLDMIKKPEYEERMRELKVTPNELWENISNYVTRGETFQDVVGKKTQEPVNHYAKERSLSFIKPEDRRPFMDDDHLHTMVQYTKSMIRQAEYIHAYGKGSEKLKGLLKEAKEKYGATDDQIALTKDYVDGLLGDKGIGMSRAQKDLYGAMIVYQNFRLLPFSLFSSLVDPLGISVRSNSLMDAGKTFAYNIKNIFRDLKKERAYESKDKWEKLAEDWGVIEDTGLMSNIGAMYENLDIRGTSKKLQEALFKYNLLNGWERNTKIMATKAAEKFMLRAKEDFFGEHNERYLRELGLSKSDLITKPDGELALRREELQAQGVSAEQAVEIEKRLMDATVKFVNQSVLNPTAGDLPNWGSNPYYAPVFHLKQFMFTFQSTILKRMVEEAKHGNYKPVWTAGVYVPGMIAADMMRGYIQNFGVAPPWQKDWTTADYLMNGVDRAGLFGTGSLISGIKEDMMHGGTGFESLMGPSLEQLKQGVMAAEGGLKAKSHFAMKAMPLNPIYDHWFLGTTDAPPRFVD